MSSIRVEERESARLEGSLSASSAVQDVMSVFSLDLKRQWITSAAPRRE